MTVTFAVDAGSLHVTGASSSGRGPAEFAELSEQILAAIVDDYNLAGEDGTVTFRMLRGRQRV